MPFSIRTLRRSPMPCAVAYNAAPFLKLPLAYCSAFWLLITLLVLSSGPAYAEWVEIAATDYGITVYVDPDTIRHEGNLVKMWELFDHKTTQTIGVGLFMSLKDQREYDCTKERFRVVTFTQFSGNMGSGKLGYSNSDETKWIPVAPQSLIHTLWKFACSKQ
jgi:surface-adhesin protein E